MSAPLIMLNITKHLSICEGKPTMARKSENQFEVLFWDNVE